MSKDRIHIIGGGIIGLCSAWYLRNAGWEVTVIDKGNLAEGTSFGNAGMIVPSHFVPLAAPGVIWKGIKWMFDKKSPFAVTPKINAELIRWVWHFHKSSTKQKVAQAITILRDYNTLSRDLYKSFALKENFRFELGERGLLMVYQKPKTEQDEIEIAEKAQRLGLEAKILNEGALWDLEKGVRLKARGAVYYPGDAHLDPRIFIEDLLRALTASGVHFITNQKVTGFNSHHDNLKEIKLDNGAVEKVSHLLIATGTWSQKICKQLSISILLQPGKGYSLTLENPPLLPSIPTILCEAKVAVTPMHKNLRVGGTMEIGNFSRDVSKKKVLGIIESLPKYYQDFNVDGLSNQRVWQGWRPCTPDGLPYLGRLNKLRNTVIATGHAMMGLSMGPATGKIVSEIFNRETPSIDLSQLQPGRF